MPNKMKRFTQRARWVLSLAQEEAELMQHSYIGTEHLLLGLLREERGVAGHVLRDLGLDTRRVEELVERMSHAGQRTSNARLDLLPESKKVLELAVDEARRMGHHYIGTEHLLLGILRLNEGIGIDVLSRLNVSPEEIQRRLGQVLQASSSRVSSEASAEGLTIARSHVSLAPPAGFVISTAYLTAQQLRHGYLGPWHLLILLMRQKGIASGILHDLGIQEQRIQKILAGEPMLLRSAGTLQLTSRAQDALEFAIDEAREKKHRFIQTEDMLLGLLRQNPAMFEQLNVSPGTIRAKIEQAIKNQSSSGGEKEPGGSQ